MIPKVILKEMSIEEKIKKGYSYLKQYYEEKDIKSPWIIKVKVFVYFFLFLRYNMLVF